MENERVIIFTLSDSIFEKSGPFLLEELTREGRLYLRAR